LSECGDIERAPLKALPRLLSAANKKTPTDTRMALLLGHYWEASLMAPYGSNGGNERLRAEVNRCHAACAKRNQNSTPANFPTAQSSILIPKDKRNDSEKRPEKSQSINRGFKWRWNTDILIMSPASLCWPK
jgi:hypothetical protein